jgi:hypothetical protein
VPARFAASTRRSALRSLTLNFVTRRWIEPRLRTCGDVFSSPLIPPLDPFEC